MFREKKAILRFFLLSALFISGIISVVAQVDTASVTGQVTDPQSAVVAGARVIITNQATNINAETTTNEEGYYTFTNLRPNLYTIEIRQTGFNTDSRKSVELNVGQKARFDFQLTVGDTTTVVDVSADNQSQLQREDASLGNVVDNRRVTTLPLPQRSWDDLLTQVAGTQGDPYTEQSGGTASGRTGSVNIHGIRSLYNNFILDGQDNNSISTNVQEFSTQISRPSIDSLGEFKVITSQFSADTGRAAGGVVSVTTKSGTNEFHGLAYEYVRNKVFDATDFFTNKFGREKAQRVQNQFGGNIGGPIWKNRAFFFADYEGTRIRQGQLRIATVPLDQFKNGNFSSLLGANQFQIFAPNANGVCQGTGQFIRQGQIFNPATTRPNPCFDANSTDPYRRLPFIRDPYTNNIITNIDPVAARFAALFPSPTTGGTPNASGIISNNFTRTPSISDDGDRFTTRLDSKINSTNDIFGRYAYGKRDRFVPGFFGGLADGTDTSAWGLTTVETHAITLGWNYVITPNVVNQFRFGYNYANADSAQEPFAEGNSSSYVRGLPDVGQGGIPAIVISGYSPRLGSPDFLPKFQKSQQYQFTNTTTWVRGAHTFRFGPDIMAPLKLDYIDVPGTRGRFDFAANYTGLPNQTASGLIGGTGNAFADFLVGRPTNVLLTNAGVVEQRRYMYSFFGQDDWKVTPRLTLNLGLRYDFGSPSYEAQNRLANFDPQAALAATNQAQALASLRLASDGSLENRSLIKPDRNNFAPRVGFAYSVDDNFVVRGGYGVYYNLLDRIGSEDQIALNPPNIINFNTRTDAPGSAVAGVTLNGGIPSNLLSPSNISIRNIQLRAANPESSTPYIQQGSIGAQYQFGNNWLAEANYVHTRGTKLYTLRDLNQPLPNQPTTRPFQQFGLIEYRDDNGISRYNALETTLDKRFSNGYTIRAVYTLSNSKDNSGEHLTSGGSSTFPDNARDLSNWYGPSDFDVRHRFVVNGILEFPFGRGRAFVNEGIGAAILGGWTLTGSLNVRSGRPFTVVQSGDPLRLGSLSTTLADLVGDPTVANQTVDNFFNPAAFQTLNNSTLRFGNQPRNSLRGPGFAALDLAIHRRFGLWNENTNLELRWEVFNALNRANFGLPNRTVNGGGFGTITTLQGDPRIMQFALRFNF
ncbi:MAG: TonB-dependent receptor [Acidobacteriota bacterium]|nr:TonB-dependent receptor [Acidobacteriota bacterium]